MLSWCCIYRCVRKRRSDKKDDDFKYGKLATDEEDVGADGEEGDLELGFVESVEASPADAEAAAVDEAEDDPDLPKARCAGEDGGEAKPAKAEIIR